MKKIYILICLSLFFVNLISCTRNVSPNSYAVGSVGQVNRAVKGIIISAREVEISGNQSGLGGSAGAAAGATAGTFIGGGARENILGAIGGAVIGGVVGSIAEEGSTRQKGIEYVIETENGALISIVQGVEPLLAVGKKIILLYGTRSRIIPDPKY